MTLENASHSNSVELTENMGEWFVRVVRDGKSTITTFELESYARAFAEGQRLGLGVPEACGKIACHP